MKLRELLQQMQDTQKKIGSSEAYICGGTPRDRYLKHLENISDLDITTGDKTVGYLSSEFGTILGRKYNVTRRDHDDGHSSIYIGSFKMDFSSNFNVPNIDAILAKQGIVRPTEMQKEMFSRDFTCNALLLSLDLKNLIDPTHKGFQDIKERKIKTCLSPEITLTSNKNRVIRAIYLASKLDFDIDQSIIDYVTRNPSSVKIASEKAMTEKLNEAFNRDADKAAFYISKMNLWEEIPITEVVQPYYMKAKGMPKQAYFQGGGGVNEPAPKKKKYKSDPAIVNQTRFKEPFYRNYDLYDIPGFEHIGPGAGWHSMEKYKSVSEFLKAKRKKMKDKYKADDSWIEDSGEITKKNPRIQARAELISQIMKTAIDFPIDDEIETLPPEHDDASFQRLFMLGPEGEPGDMSTFPGFPNLGDNSSFMHATEIGGGEPPLFYPDFEGKPPTTLNYGRDYEEDGDSVDEELLSQIMDKYLSHEQDSDLYGLPDGFNHSEEDTIIDEMNPDYGTLGPESLIYEDKWNI